MPTNRGFARESFYFLLHNENFLIIFKYCLDGAHRLLGWDSSAAFPPCAWSHLSGTWWGRWRWTISWCPFLKTKKASDALSWKQGEFTKNSIICFPWCYPVQAQPRVGMAGSQRDLPSHLQQKGHSHDPALQLYNLNPFWCGKGRDKTVTAWDWDAHRGASWKDQQGRVALLFSASLGSLGASKAGLWFTAFLQKWLLGSQGWCFERSGEPGWLPAVYQSCQKDVAFGERWNLLLWHGHMAGTRWGSCTVRLKKSRVFHLWCSALVWKHRESGCIFSFLFFLWGVSFLFSFFLLHFHWKCNANRSASMTELFHNHHKIQVLVLLETGAARCVCALLIIFTKPQKLPIWVIKPRHQVWMYIFQKLILELFCSASSANQNSSI